MRVFALFLVVAMTPGCGADAPEPLPLGSLNIGDAGATLRVEIAESDATRAQGLMGRRALPADAGMVFLLPEARDGYFWMKNTLLPLSIAFWGSDHRIVSILDMEPCSTDPCADYDPGVAYVGAVEANQGWFEDNGVHVGDSVELDR